MYFSHKFVVRIKAVIIFKCGELLPSTVTHIIDFLSLALWSTIVYGILFDMVILTVTHR